jgi:hypothetical protein
MRRRAFLTLLGGGAAPAIIRTPALPRPFMASGCADTYPF